ncbi:MAG: cyanophycin synthetase, partial [Candidatus Latescibacterota bacterium]
VHTEVEAGAWAAGGRVWVRPPGGPAAAACLVEEVPLRGRHNVANAAAAAAAAVALGIPADQIGAGIRTFRGLEHRLERVAERQGVAYYNDSLATTPDSAIAALQAFDEPVVLIAGGSSKGADFAALGACIARRAVKAVVLLGQEGVRLEAALRQAGYGGEVVTGCPGMEAAVEAARCRAAPGDAVLLSPACASFGMFANYRDRGEQFRRCVLASA